MDEMRQILLDQGRKYPKMQPTDAVKLIYQNTFGGGHLIRDEASCLNYLRREYAATIPDPGMALTEDIGNGILRVNLAALPPEELEHLGSAFLRSAAAHTGTPERFLEMLAVLRSVTAEGHFSFGLTELNAYLAEYERAGFPPVSHSAVYREAYHPAYRVVLAGEFHR